MEDDDMINIQDPSEIPETPKLRTLDEIMKAASALSEENADTKVTTIVNNSNLPEEQKESLYVDLMAKLKPITGWAKEKADEILDNESLINITNDLKRQLGLTVRAAGEGGAGLVGLAYDPLALIIEIGDKIVRGDNAEQIPLLRSQMAQLLDSIGVPKAESTVERVVNVMSEGAVGGGGFASLSNRLSSILSGTSQNVAKIMAAAPVTQAVGGGTSGGVGQGAAELGYGPVVQTIASIAGGLFGGKTSNIKTEPISIDTKNTVRLAEDLNVPVLTSDVRSPETFAGKWLQRTSESIPAAGTGNIRANQQSARVNSVQDLASSWGVDLGNDVDVISTVAGDLLRKRGNLLKQYTSTKSSVIDSQQLQDAGVVDVSKTINAIDQELDTLMKLRSTQTAPVIERLKDWRAALLGERTVKAPNGKTIIVQDGQNLQSIEQLRKFIGEAFADPSLASVKTIGNKALNRIYAPLRDDMGAFIKTYGNRNDLKKWQVSNARLSELAGELDNSIFKSVLKKGEVSPEEVTRLLFSKKPSDIKLLFKNLDNIGRANAKTAIITDMFKKSINANESVSPEVFKTQIKKMSNTLGVFFNEKELNSIQGLGRVLALTKRAGEASVLPPTGAVLQIPIITGFLTQSFGGVGSGLVAAVGIGAVARVLESAPVRNLLIKLPKTKPGSKQEAEIVKRLNEVIMLETGAREPIDDNQISSLGANDSTALSGIIDGINNEARSKILNASTV